MPIIQWGGLVSVFDDRNVGLLPKSTSLLRFLQSQCHSPSAQTKMSPSHSTNTMHHPLCLTNVLIRIFNSIPVALKSHKSHKLAHTQQKDSIQLAIQRIILSCVFIYLHSAAAEDSNLSHSKPNVWKNSQVFVDNQSSLLSKCMLETSYRVWNSQRICAISQSS